MLVEAAVEALSDCDAVKLDATPAGREVYEKLGFVDEYRLSRQTVRAMPALGRPPSGVRPMEETDLEAVAALDGEAFGVTRSALVRGLRDMAPEYAAVVEDGRGEIVGFALGRHGEHFEQIGPVVARDRETALRLARGVFSRMAGSAVLVDVTLHAPEWLDWLASLGFAEERPFVRMYRGANTYPGRTELTFAVSGPEMG